MGYTTMVGPDEAHLQTQIKKDQLTVEESGQLDVKNSAHLCTDERAGTVWNAEF